MKTTTLNLNVPRIRQLSFNHPHAFMLSLGIRVQFCLPVLYALFERVVFPLTLGQLIGDTLREAPYHLSIVLQIHDGENRRVSRPDKSIDIRNNSVRVLGIDDLHPVDVSCLFQPRNLWCC